MLQIFGFLWAVTFTVAIGSYTFLAASVVGHIVLVAVLAITVATYIAATTKPKLFMRGFTRRGDNEQE